MNDAYYRWLIQFLNDEYLEMNYQKLLWKLYTTDFFWELEYDGNRAADGLYLRKIFVEECGLLRGGNCGENNGQNCCQNYGFKSPKTGIRKIDENAPCSVLEMMIALAKKTEHDIMYDPKYGDRTELWFWVMLQNLGLDRFDDYGYFEEDVERILEVFMRREYAPDGYGGMFPNFGIERDLRKTDLWWQMNAFLVENYPM